MGPAPLSVLRPPPKRKPKLASIEMAPASVADCHEQRIAMLDVPELVRQHAGKLILVRPLQKPSRNGDGGMLWVAPRGERVRLWIVHDIDPRHRQPRLSRQLPDEPVKL